MAVILPHRRRLEGRPQDPVPPEGGGEADEAGDHQHGATEGQEGIAGPPERRRVA